MGTISIPLGIITFFTFTAAGAFISNKILDAKIAGSLLATLVQNVPNMTITIVVVGVFTFIGLLIGVSLVMHGLNYNKLAKIQKLLKRKG